MASVLVIGFNSSTNGANHGKMSTVDREKLSQALTRYDNFGADWREGLLPVLKEEPNQTFGKWGFIDKSGNEIIPCICLYYDLGHFHEGLARMSIDGKKCFIDKTGKEVIPFIFDYACSFSDGLAMVRIGEDLGFIDKDGYFIGRGVVKKIF